jgi:HAD superfamily hydrolase (TIGR01509 family)
VLFDMDGTLTNTEEIWTEALHGMARDLGGQLSPVARARMLGRSLGEVIEMLHTETGSRADTAMTRRALLGRVEDLMGRGVPWQPGARELLSAVRHAGLRTALVTSSPRGLVDIAMTTLGHDAFDVTLCGDEVRRPKPDPEPYRTAMAMLGLSPDQCMAVEDSEPGAVSAERAGLAVLVVPSADPIPATPARTSVPTLAGQTPHSLGLIAARYQARTLVHGVA